MRLLALLVATCCLLAAGCSQRVAVDAYQAPTAKLPPGAAVYVMLPADGGYGGTIFPWSGAATAQAVSDALGQRDAHVVRAAAFEYLPDALRSAASQGLSYVFEARILNWEDHLTPISPTPDRITMQYIVYAVADGRVVASTTLRASSPLGSGGFHPKDLLIVPTRAFVDGLF